MVSSQSHISWSTRLWLYHLDLISADQPGRVKQPSCLCWLILSVDDERCRAWEATTYTVDQPIGWLETAAYWASCPDVQVRLRSLCFDLFWRNQSYFQIKEAWWCIYPWEKNWPPWLLTVSSRWPKWSQPAMTEPWPGPWLSCDLAVTEPWSYWRCSQPAVNSPWLSCDLTVTELWPSRDRAVTELWPSRKVLAMTEPWSLGPRSRDHCSHCELTASHGKVTAQSRWGHSWLWASSVWSWLSHG